MAKRSAKATTKKTGRERAIELIERRLRRTGRPRLQMTLILMLTGAAGFLISFALLHIGFTRMWLRYPLAILLAYCVFLLLLRFWLFSHSRERGSGLDVDSSILDVGEALTDFIPSDGASSAAEVFKLGGAGDFGGGGSGGSWAEGLSSASSAPQAPGGSFFGSGSSGGGSGGGSSGGGGLGLDLDLDEGCLIILALIFILGGIIASLYVVYIAPVLLAEILVDGLLLTGLYKRMKGVEQGNWLMTAVRKTLLAALVVAFFFSIAGYLFQKAVPRAHSIGDVWTSRESE